jgi:uncharacterized membrane protein YphA (DoxX/SURF4 family)
MIDLLFNGVGWTDIALTLNRVAVGLFFMFSGYHKLFNAQRHRMMLDDLKALHVPALRINQWWVPIVEFFAGGGVVVGLVAPLAALGLLVIILVAGATSGRQRIRAYKPIDEADRIDDWLYLPETLYAFMLIMVISAGAGPYSLDALILRHFKALPSTQASFSILLNRKVGAIEGRRIRVATETILIVPP